MKIIDIKRSLPKERQSLFGITQDTKKGLLEVLATNINLLLRKRIWTLSQAGRIYIYMLIRTYASTDKEREGFYEKYRDNVNKKTREALSLTENVKPYSVYTSLFDWLRLVRTRLDLYMSIAETAHMVILGIIRTAARCEYVLPKLKEETKKNLYPISLDQFISNKDQSWQSNIKKFNSSTSKIKEMMIEIICYNRTLELISELIDIKELLLLLEDLINASEKIDRFISHLLGLRKEIEEKKIKYDNEKERKEKIEVIGELIKIFDDNNNIMESWINKNSDVLQECPPIYKEGIKLAKIIRDDINGKGK